MIQTFVTYECKADSKGRITVPSGLKVVLDKELQNGFVLKPSVFNRCIELYPQGEWQEIMEKMRAKLNLFSKQHLDYLRKFTAGVKEVEVSLLFFIINNSSSSQTNILAQLMDFFTGNGHLEDLSKISDPEALYAYIAEATA